MADQAFLSFRLPAGERDRLKAIAARRGESVQRLMGRLVENCITEDRGRPELSEVRRLRARKEELRHRGVARLWIFGSLVRGETGPDSDIDLLVDFDPEAKVTLTGVSRLRQDLEDLLGARIDLAERRTLKSHVREAAEQDAVAVF